MHPKTRTKLISVLLASALALSACGGGADEVVASDELFTDTDTSAEQDADAPADADDTDTAEAAPADSEPEAVVSTEDAAAAADVNRDALTLTNDARTTEVLNVKTGGIATLQDAVVGDRPVLLWFFSPH